MKHFIKSATSPDSMGNAATSRRAPMYISYRPYDGNNNLENHLNWQLKQGMIPPLYREVMHLVGEGEDKNADIVIAYIRRVLDRMAIATTGKPNPSMRIVLSDRPGPNAAIITDTGDHDPILIVGLGLLDELVQKGYGEDHMAAILGHERFHYLRHIKWAGLENGRPEEAVGDGYGVYEAAKAGYNPQSLSEFFEALRIEEKKNRGGGRPHRNFVSLFDEHPNLSNRVRNTEMVLAKLHLTQRFGTSVIPIPADILDAAAKVNFSSTYERYKQEVHFDEKTPVECLGLIARYIVEQINEREFTGKEWGKKKGENIINDELMAYRVLMPHDDLQTLKAFPGVSTDAMRIFRSMMIGTAFRRQRGGSFAYENKGHYTYALRMMAEIATDKTYEPGHFVSEHGVYGMHLEYFESTELPLVFRRIKQGANAFWKAKTKAEAAQIASTFIQSWRYLKKYQTGLNLLGVMADSPRALSRQDIRNSINAEGYCRLPWENQVGWATEDDSQDSQDIRWMALSTGCEDPRLNGEYPRHEMGGYGQYSYNFSELHFDDKGNIIAMDMNEDERNAHFRQRYEFKTGAEFFERETRLLAARAEEEEAAVSQTNWDDMRKDFWEFVDVHAHLLEPQFSPVPTRYPFASAFMGHLNKLVQENREEWWVTYQRFVNGYRDPAEVREDSKTSSYYRVEDYVRGNTIPAILTQTREKYFGYGEMYGHYEFFRGKRVPRGALPEGHPHAEQLRSYEWFYNERPYDRVHPKTGRYIQGYKLLPTKGSAKEEINIPFCIAHDHPFMAAIIDPNINLSSEGRSALASHFEYFRPNAATIEQVFTCQPNMVIGYQQPKTAKDFHKIGGEFRSNKDTMWLLAKPIELLQTLRWYDTQSVDQRFSLSELDSFLVGSRFRDISNRKLRKQLKDELHQLVDRQIARNARIDFQDDVTLPDLIGRFISDQGRKDTRGDRYSVFAFRLKLENKYLSHIRSRIMALPVADRTEPLQQLMAIQLKDPTYRDWAIGEWVSSVTCTLGQDIGDSAYAQLAQQFIKGAGKQMVPSHAISCALKLLDAVQSQREVSLWAKDHLIDVYGARFFQADKSMRGLDAVIAQCGYDSELRAAFLKYITEPLTKNGTDAFIAVLISRAQDETEGIRGLYDATRNMNVSVVEQRSYANYMHQNFWEMPFAVRTIYLDRILFPVDNERSDTKAFDEAVNFVLDKVLPLDQKFAPESREALLVYLECCPYELRRATFSAILATTEHSSRYAQMRPGQVLSYTFTRTGAAGGMILQAAHSYLSGLKLDDPDLIQLRDDLKSNKDNYDPPYRFEIFERMDDILPANHPLKHRRIGKVLGCGSTAFVVETQGKTEDDESALKIMRKEVLPIADLQFERFEKAFRILAERHAHYRQLPDMVVHARSLLDAAVDGRIAGKQIRYAERLYNGLQVTVNGKPYHFVVSKYIRSGPEFVEMARVHGANLNAMPPGRKRERDATAIETAEVYHQLRGVATDKDRHGAQQGIVGQTIGMFDVAQIPFSIEKNRIAQPTKEQRRALGRALGQVFMQANENSGSMVSVMSDVVTAMPDGPIKSYLVGEQRSVLARMDVHSKLARDDDGRMAILMGIFKAVAATGKIHRDVMKGFSDAVGMKVDFGQLAYTGKRRALIVINDSRGLAPIN